MARLAEQVDGVARAGAAFRFTGSWTTAFVAIDPLGRIGVASDLRDKVRDHVTPRLPAGYDLEVVDPDYVPIELSIEVTLQLQGKRKD